MKSWQYAVVTAFCTVCGCIAMIAGAQLIHESAGPAVTVFGGFVQIMGLVMMLGPTAFLMTGGFTFKTRTQALATIVKIGVGLGVLGFALLALGSALR